MQVTLTATGTYQIYVDATEAGLSTINFVCGPDEVEIANTSASPGTGLGSSDASLDFFTPSAAGLHYVNITTNFGGKTVLVADRDNDELEPTVPVGGTATGTFGTATDTDGVEVPMVSGTTYQIYVRFDGYPSIDPWTIDIHDPGGNRITRPAGTTEAPYFGASYDGFFDHDPGPGNAARVVYTATETGNHFIEFGSRGAPRQRLGDWHLEATEASAPFYDDYAADASTTGTVSVGGSVSGRIDSTPSWYNAGDTGGPNGYSSHEPGWTGAYSGYSCHEETGDGIKLDGDTCDRDWFEVMLTVNRTYNLQLEGDQDKLLIAGVYRNGVLFQRGGGTYRARSTSIHYISVAGMGDCYGLHGCTGSYTLSVTEE